MKQLIKYLNYFDDFESRLRYFEYRLLRNGCRSKGYKILQTVRILLKESGVVNKYGSSGRAIMSVLKKLEPPYDVRKVRVSGRVIFRAFPITKERKIYLAVTFFLRAARKNKSCIGRFSNFEFKIFSEFKTCLITFFDSGAYREQQEFLNRLK